MFTCRSRRQPISARSETKPNLRHQGYVGDTTVYPRPGDGNFRFGNGLSRLNAKEHVMLKFLGGAVGVIFIIGLLVVIGLLALIF